MLSLWKFNLLLMAVSIMFFGCRPPEEETQYNIAKFVSPLEGSQCTLAPEDGMSDADQVERCQLQDGCQAVLDEGNKYLGCMPTPSDETPTPPSSGDDDDSAGPTPPAGDDDDDYTPPPSGDDDDDYTPPPSGDDDDDYTPPSSGDDDDDDDDSNDPKAHACTDPNEGGQFKVLVCHMKANNKNFPDERGVTICIANPAWENAHSGIIHNHGGKEDYLGACKQADL